MIWTRTLALAVLALVVTQGVCAQETAAVSQPLSQDIFLVLDNSGSMRQNDPSFLMRTAVTSFVSRLAPETRLGLIAFDDRVQVLLDLTPASQPDFQTLAAGAVQRLDYGGQRTDIPGGVERALYALREQGRPEAARIIVLLTDGIVDVGNPTADIERARWLRESLAGDARTAQIRIFGIAFTDAADYQLLQSLAAQTSGGYFRAGTADELMVSLERLSAKLGEPPPPPPTPTPAAGVANPVVPEAPQGRWGRWLGNWRVLVALGAAGLVLLIGFLIVLVLFFRRPRQESKPAASAPMPAATLRDLGGYSQAEMHPLKQPVFRIGRIAGLNDLVLPYDSVTKQHALIEFRDGCFHVRDLRSTNGTYVNGEQVEQDERILKHGDTLAFHRCEFEFVIDELWEEAGTTYMPRPEV